MSVFSGAWMWICTYLYVFSSVMGKHSQEAG